MRHVSASTYGHDHAFVHYIKVNIHMDTCHLYTLQKPDDGHRQRPKHVPLLKISVTLGGEL